MSRRTIANKLTSLILAFIMCLTMGFIDGRVFAAEDTAETSEMITDIDLSGEEVDVDGEEYFVDDVTVRFSLNNDAWIQRAEITINEEEAAYKTYEDDTTLQLEDSLIIPADYLNSLKSEDRVLECLLTVTDVDGATYSSDFELPFYQYIEDAIVDKDNDEDIERLGDSSKTKAKKYLIKVNKTCNVVTVYKRASNKKYYPYKVMICSCAREGKETPVGTWKIGPSKKACDRSKWALLSGGTSYAQYLVRFKGTKCFHSVIYGKRYDNASMKLKTYNNLGTAQSAGCVRLKTRDAKWIYDNCPNGTVVKIYESKEPGPLGKPGLVALSLSNGSVGWDPTDPDEDNPFNKLKAVPSGVDKDISKNKVTLTDDSLTYNGSYQKPQVQINNLVEGTHFSVSYPGDSTTVGKHKLIVFGEGKCTGQVSKTYKIFPMQTDISNVSGSKKSFVVSWDKVSKQATGYQIRFSSHSDFKKSITKKITSYKTTSTTIKTAKTGINYYVKIRTYKKAGGVIYCSKWSDVQTVFVGQKVEETEQ